MAQKAFVTFFLIVMLAFSFAMWSATVAATNAVVSDTIIPPSDQMSEEVPSDATLSATPTVEYTLPYPGILPDHPLYKIKLFRDRALDFLIRDPLKRIEFNLLMADKRLNMGISLTEKERYALAEETVSKGEKYFVHAVDEFKKARDEGREIPGDLVNRLRMSSEKHILVISDLKAGAPESVQAGYDTSLRLATENRDRLVSLTQ